MADSIDKLLIELCENLPFDLTLFERLGFCEKPSEFCDYCQQQTKDSYLCAKKTYILDKTDPTPA